MKSLIVVSGLVLSAWAAPQAVTFGANDKSVTSCGLVNNVQRNVGDTWADDCNNCVCRETGIATCTKRFCGNIPVIRNPNEAVTSCGIVNGAERNVGDTWTDDCNNCVCRETGVSTCTKRFCGNIPVLKNPKEAVTSCGVLNGEERNVGDTWTDDCNNCICRETGVATCTQRFCGGGDRPAINFAAVCKNAINGTDRLEGESWTAADGCNTCKCLKSGIPGCTKKFCGDVPIITAPRDIPCLGCPQESEVDDDITAAAAHATASLSGISDSGCGGIRLVKVENAKKQVVAGTNFVLTLRLETREGQGCADKTEKICENIVVFKPLPFNCQSDDGCLELTRQTDISCKPVKPGT